MARSTAISPILTRWIGLKVPLVEIYRPNLKKRPCVTCWVSKNGLANYSRLSNPQIDAAYHICAVLPNRPAPVRMAYYMYAFALESLKIRFQPALDSFINEVLDPVFCANDESVRDWWPSNARLVLPPGGVYPTWWYRDARPPSVTQIVDAAAYYWTGVAQKSMAVMDPQWEPRRPVGRPVFGDPDWIGLRDGGWD